jgi:hypothetical protein
MVFYHGLRLGTQLHHGWYRGVWIAYGITLVGAITYSYYARLHNKAETLSSD